MRVDLFPAPWYSAAPTAALSEVPHILGGGTWREAAIHFYAERTARIRHGRTAPKGMQRQLNEVIETRMLEAGWSGADGRYFKNDTWVRITFRHQMSLGSDILDALKVCGREGYTQAAILAGDREWLRIVSPNDCGALVSFQKLRVAVAELAGVIEAPLYIGALSAQSVLPPEIESELRKQRPRDLTVPEQSAPQGL